MRAQSAREAHSEHAPSTGHTVPHNTTQHSTITAQKGRNTSGAPRHCGAYICQLGSSGRYPPDLKGYGLSRTWQHEEGGPPRNRRRSAFRVFVNVRLPRPHSFNGCHEATTDIHGWALCFAFLPESIHSLAQRRVPMSEIQTFFCFLPPSGEQLDEHLALIYVYPGTWDRGNMT